MLLCMDRRYFFHHCFSTACRSARVICIDERIGWPVACLGGMPRCLCRAFTGEQGHYAASRPPGCRWSDGCQPVGQVGFRCSWNQGPLAHAGIPNDTLGILRICEEMSSLSACPCATGCQQCSHVAKDVEACMLISVIVVSTAMRLSSGK